jgi:hypothetical protein
MSKQTFNWKATAIATILASIISSGLAYSIAKQEVENSRKFRVVDIKKLTEASMENVRELIQSSGEQLSKQGVELIAQNEAKKMFEAIARSGRGKDIILPKTSALFTPDGYEITEEIALQLGFTGVKNSTFSSRLNKAANKNENN